MPPKEARPTVRIIGPDNGAGLSKDRSVLSKVFLSAGWEVCYAEPRAVQHKPVDVQVHLEVLSPDAMKFGGENVVVPNPEWWWNDWTSHLARCVVWAKTRDCERIFLNLPAKSVRYIGFSSEDKLKPSVRTVKEFLHLAGASLNKNTQSLVDNWRNTFPTLHIVSLVKLTIPSKLSNIVVYSRLLEDKITELQNQCLFHIYPSLYEGYGHAQWEGLSSGAIVVVASSPPFNQYTGGFQYMAADYLRKEGLVSKYKARPESYETIVPLLAQASESELQSMRAASRLYWEDNKTLFHKTVAQAISDLTPSKVVYVDRPAYNFVGRVNCITGQGEAARHQLHVLRQAGLYFNVVDSGSCGSPDPQGSDEFVQQSRKSDGGVAKGTIFHLQPNLAEVMRATQPRPHILVSVWETTKLPTEWVNLINTYDQVWCATKWQLAVYQKSGVAERLLRYVPFSLDHRLYSMPREPRSKADLVKFLAVFQWSERKNPQALLKAFSEVSQKIPCTLTLKTYEGDKPSGSVTKYLSGLAANVYKRITMLTGSLTRHDMIKLYNSHDVLVSTHRGEGFGLPLAEAMLSGMKVIATDFSAPSEYGRTEQGASLINLVTAKLIPAAGMGNWQPFYHSDQNWADVDHSELVAAMLTCAEPGSYPDASVAHERTSRFVELAQLAGVNAKRALSELK